MTRIALAPIFSLVACGCEVPGPLSGLFRPAVEKHCGGPCPTAAAREASLRADARKEWLTTGTCSQPAIEECAKGGTRINSGWGLCANLVVYDSMGNAAYAEGGCEQDFRKFGPDTECLVTRQRSICDEVKASLVVDRVEVSSWGGGYDARIDGVLVIDRPDPVYPLGEHTVVSGGVELEVVAEASPEPLTALVRVTSRTPGLEITLAPGKHQPSPDGAGVRCQLDACRFTFTYPGTGRKGGVSVKPRVIGDTGLRTFHRTNRP